MEQWLSFLILKEKERTRGSKRNHQERHGGIVSRQSEHSGVQSEPAEKKGNTDPRSTGFPGMSVSSIPREM